ncbi:hypothetical protein V8C37DRAFT_368759 [Trichoderma ceciliae]
MGVTVLCCVLCAVCVCCVLCAKIHVRSMEYSLLHSTDATALVKQADLIIHVYLHHQAHPFPALDAYNAYKVRITQR